MSWTKQSAIIVGATVVALATAEILLQLVDYPDTRKSYYSRHVAGLPLHDSQHHFCYGPKYWRRYDKTVVRREYANQQYFEFRNEVVSLHTLNQFGFRGGGWGGMSWVLIKPG